MRYDTGELFPDLKLHLGSLGSVEGDLGWVAQQDAETLETLRKTYSEYTMTII